MCLISKANEELKLISFTRSLISSMFEGTVLVLNGFTCINKISSVPSVCSVNGDNGGFPI